MKKAFLQLHSAIFLAGFTGILGRLITLNEGLLVWYRMMIASIVMLAILYIGKKLQRLSFRQLLPVVGVGALIAAHWVTFYASIKYSNVSVALVCFSSVGFFTALFEPVLLKKKFNIIELLLGLLTIIGISLIFQFDPQYKFGIIIGIISAVIGSVFPIFNGQLVKKFEASTITVYELFGGFLFLTVILPLYLKYFPADYYLPTLSDFLWLLFLAILCTVLAFNLLMNALKKISAFTVNLSYNLEPVYGIALAFLVYREDKYLGGAFYLGLGLIMLSVVLQSYRVYWESKRKLRN